MMIIGCDFHPSWQQVSWLDTETGDTGERKLVQASGDAERFYRQLPVPSLIGMEATGNCHWLVDLLAEIGHELWVGRRSADPGQLRTAAEDGSTRRGAHTEPAGGRAVSAHLDAVE
jgi:transposase